MLCAPMQCGQVILAQHTLGFMSNKPLRFFKNTVAFLPHSKSCLQTVSSISSSAHVSIFLLSQRLFADPTGVPCSSVGCCILSLCSLHSRLLLGSWWSAPWCVFICVWVGVGGWGTLWKASALVMHDLTVPCCNLKYESFRCTFCSCCYLVLKKMVQMFFLCWTWHCSH